MIKQKIKKSAKYFSLFLLFTFILAGFSLIVFFKKNNAPILQGNLFYHLSYKEDLHLDIYQPTKKIHKKNPVVVYVHGGAWIIGRKESINNGRLDGAFNLLREQGYSIISPTYTLGQLGKSPFPSCIDDINSALKWIKDNQEKYNFDTKNIGIIGESAGAHIAMMVAYQKEVETPRINYLVGIYGPVDLNRLYLEGKPLLDSLNLYLDHLPEKLHSQLDFNQYLFGFDPEIDSLKTQKFAAQFSPIEFIGKSAPPTLLVHGSKDRLVPYQQSESLIQKLDSLNIPHQLLTLEGVDHAFRGATEEQMKKTHETIVDFIIQKYRSN